MGVVRAEDETKEMPVNHKEKRLQTNLKKTLLYKMTTKNTHIDKLCYCIVCPQMWVMYYVTMQFQLKYVVVFSLFYGKHKNLNMNNCCISTLLHAGLCV